ncbi:hypothetical protein GGI15_002674 [Coemansia interrupta]|uniref:PUM-HD domain-containing protein n=1 Tax=Coemansia interrupta TaxID=1126814 RepID=A0A9W8LKR4_9FUNG|nr:hypothetical protein GGI15_002674 [Coemansia interrupta]
MSGPTKPFDPFGSASEAKILANDSSASVSAGGSTISASQPSSDSSSSTSPTTTAINTKSAMTVDAAAAAASAGNNGSSDSTANASSTSAVDPASLFAANISQKLSGVNQSLRHTSIFEIGGEPFGPETPAAGTPGSRLSRIVGATNGTATPLSSTSSPMGILPLGSIMGSPHGLFNDSTYGAAGQSQLPLPSSRGSHTPSGTQISHQKAHRLSQSRFGSILGDSNGLQPSAIGRVVGSDKDGSGIAGHTSVDMSIGMLDSMKSQQASPNTSAQTIGFNDFYVRSLPVSRRNSQEFQNLWQELEGFSINDSSAHPSAGISSVIPGHLSGLDGHSVAARNGSGAFRGSGAAILGTSPKLPQGLLDDEGLSIGPKTSVADLAGGQPGVLSNGLARKPTAGLANAISSTDLASMGAYRGAGGGSNVNSSNANHASGFMGYMRDGRADGFGGNTFSQNQQQQQQQHVGPTTDYPNATDAVSELRAYDPARGVNLIRNASTPVLNNKQYQVMQSAENMPLAANGPGRGGMPAGAVYADPNGRLDSQAPVYNATQFQQQGYPGGNLAGSNYQHPSANTQGMVVGRNHSFIANQPSVGAPAMHMTNGYGLQNTFGSSNTALPVTGVYGMGHLSVPPTPMQHPHHGSSHVHVHSSQPQQQSSQQQQGVKSQRQHQQPVTGGKSALAGSGSSMSHSNQGHGSAGIGSSGNSGSSGQKHAGNKSVRRNEGDVNKFANATLEDLQGTIFDVCRDQYGCRFLQKLLEEGRPDQFETIFNEATQRFSELMTDPFGNYLCQKLFEYCNETQRTQIIRDVAPSLVSISLNMHGTRAVQKMIESLSNQEQITYVIDALHGSVVMLIRDLNGNHVIQKCLSQLTSDNNQFIYDSVAASCSDVATHRQGCCVFQRCIDFSTDKQKLQLVNVVIEEALSLVQDPFGNYVVQYVLELGIMEYSEPLILRFVDHICGLSVQKFSSNVMEKCIRIASAATRRLLVAPLLQRDKLEILMRDSYGNYVVQTAMDFADQTQRLEIIEAIIPLLPLIRHTPYGKRIFIKLQRDGFVSAVPSAAGSRHASPTLGPSHGGHSSAAISTMPLYPPMALPAMNGSMPPPAAASSASALSRGVSPITGNNNGGKQQQQQQQRAYAPGGPGTNGMGVYQQGHPTAHYVQHQHHHPALPPAPGSMYFYNMAGMDGVGQVSQGPAGHMPLVNGVYEAHQQPGVLPGQGPLSAPSTSSAAAPLSVSGPPGAKLHTTSYYGNNR